ncbi:MAG: hypothetical protein WBH51_05725 [Mycolicibacter algericus]|uniref:hypothetical protein n=1 Tax=Mycolicibacter algericus TaxID=1288388 RepID=UPI003C78AC48
MPVEAEAPVVHEEAGVGSEGHAEQTVDAAESAAVHDDRGEVQGAGDARAARWRRVLAYGVLPALALLLAMAGGAFKWMGSSIGDSQAARVEAVQAAKDATVAMLSYQPETVEKELTDAQAFMTGTFRDSYAQLIRDVVIPGAKQQRISAVANVPAAASISATPDHSVVLVFVNQTSTIGSDAPTDTASSVRVALDRVGGRWLISDFTPV